MKRLIKKILLTSLVVIVLCVSFFALLILNPGFLYAHETSFGQITVHHQYKLDTVFHSVLKRSLEIVQKGALYEQDLRIDFCLYEDSHYPRLVRLISGNARAAALLNKAVLLSPAHFSENYSLFNNHKWQLDQLIAHELTHCYQIHSFGVRSVMKSFWKTEGYAEYVARRSPQWENLRKNIRFLQDAKAKGGSSDAWIPFPGDAGGVIDYFTYMLMIQYLIEQEAWSYEQIMVDETPERVVFQRMMDWYASPSH